MYLIKEHSITRIMRHYVERCLRKCVFCSNGSMDNWLRCDMGDRAAGDGAEGSDREVAPSAPHKESR